VPFEWNPGTTLLPLTGDDAAIPVPLPFAFSFYGQTYNTAYVTTNGNINFQGLNAGFVNACIPNTGLPNAAVYGLRDDLLIEGGAGVYTKTEGEAPSRKVVIEWRNATFYGRPPENVATFEMILHEADGSILLQYNRTDGDGNGASATIGTENATGTIGLQYSCNEAVGRAILYRPPAP